MACGKKITIKIFQLCSIKIKEATPPVTSHATALFPRAFLTCDQKGLESDGVYQHDSLIPRPLPDFISQPWLRDKIWEWPGDETSQIVLSSLAH